jgi:hypothetical protein
MANTAAPFGFRDYAKLDGSAPNYALEPFTILSSDANAYFDGDVVALSSAAGFLGTLAPFSSGAVNVPVGVFRGCEFFNAATGRQVWSRTFPGTQGSSSPATAYVCTDPEMLFYVQVSSAAVTTTSIGTLHNVVTATAGNTATGTSGMALDTAATTSVSSVAYSTTQPFKIWTTYASASTFNTSVNGGDDTTNFNIVIVKPNAWFRTYLGGQST